MMRIDLKIIRTKRDKTNRLRRAETEVSIPLNDNPPMDVLKALWNFEEAVNAHSEARIHLNVVDSDSEPPNSRYGIKLAGE